MRLETPVLPTALCKSSRIRHSPNSGTVRRFPVLPTPCAKTAKSCAFCDSMPVLALELSTLFPNSAPLNSGLWLGAFGKVWLFRCQSGIRGLWLTAFGKSEFFRCQSGTLFGGFGLGLLVSQSFLGAKAPLRPGFA